MELHSTENENENKYSSCRVYIVLMIVVLTFLLELLFILFIAIVFLIKNNVSHIKFNTHKETKIW